MTRHYQQATAGKLGLHISCHLEEVLVEALSRADFSGCFDAAMLEQASALEPLLELAREFAVPPISGFKVGALVIGKSGAGYLGANMEFAGVPLHASLHAEQSAVINAWMHGETGIDSILVSELPCGHCRQFLQELPNAADLLVSVRGEQMSLGELMPAPFTQLAMKGRGLLDSPKQRLVSTRPEVNDNAQRAINAASRSYTPYSRSPEGFVIETLNGRHFAGRSAESVAFNPSVPAVITALNQLNLSADRRETVVRCTHAKLATALTHSLAFSEAILRHICSQPVETVLMETGG